jgi:hypothetical protein
LLTLAAACRHRLLLLLQQRAGASAARWRRTRRRWRRTRRRCRCGGPLGRDMLKETV